MRNYLTIAGTDSRDFGVYISGQGTFSAPEKAYQFYSISGRNGDIIGNDHRLENIEVSYECFIYSNFSKNIADFRTFLLSLDGYQRITDSYHTDEYRMGVYVGPFEPEVTSKNDAGSFTLTFNCKPQRWLISGETKYTWVPNSTVMVKGEEIDVYVPRVTNNGAVTILFDGTTSAQGGSLHAQSYIGFYVDGALARGVDFNGDRVIKGNIYLDSGTANVSHKIMNVDSLFLWVGSDHKCFVSSGDVGIDEVLSCTRGNIQYTVIEDPASYQDMIDQITAEDYAICSYNNRLYVRDVSYTDSVSTGFRQVFKEAYTWVKLSNTETYTFTSYNLTQDGYVRIKANFPKSTVQVIYTSNNEMTNPTMFPSKPLIRVYGDGVFTMDGVTVTVTNSTQYTDIDCELMDCYEGTTNRNKDVTFSTYDFPELKVGGNEINIVSGITLVELTPRWWLV